jgi:protocatechuate 3,4-dioxygenase beta subunit
MGLRPLAVVAAALLLAGSGAVVAMRVADDAFEAPRPGPVAPRVPAAAVKIADLSGPVAVSLDLPRTLPPAKAESPEVVDFPPIPDEMEFVWEDGTLPADPDVVPATGEAPVVAPGRPAEVEIGAFVARGGAAPDAVVRLVGARKPTVEEGVPVSLTGRVVEDLDGAPIAGAHVIVTSAFYVRRYFYDHHLREVARAETDADGAFRIDRLNVDPVHFGNGGRLYLTVTAEGHAPELALELVRVSPGVANRVKDVRLPRVAGTLRGRVLDMWEGKPVVGARVHATGSIDPIAYPKDERPALFLGAPTAVTDAEGRFLLEGLGSGPQFISVHGGDDCAGSESVSIPFKGEFSMKTRALRGRIEGTMVDGQGDPVALVLVAGGENTTHSFADGRWVLENFRGDSVKVTFSHPDFRDVVLAGVKDGTTGLFVHMEHPRTRLVLDVKESETAAPVKRLEMAFGSEPATTLFPDPGSKYLSPDGRYEVRLPEGETLLFIYANGRQPATVDLAGRADGEVVPVLLAPTAR